MTRNPYAAGTTDKSISHALSEVLEELGVGLTDATPKKQVLEVRFSNPDISYLTRRHELEPRFIGRMLRIFGEAVVLETLRRFEKGWSEAVFVGVCRNVEGNR